MELWIRSQDGERLTRCYDLRMYYAMEEDLWVIESCDDLGCYKTRERALQVLDEIQNILQPRVYMKAPSLVVNPKDMIEDLTNGICLHTTQQVELELKQAGQFVYQMPKE